MRKAEDWQQLLELLERIHTTRTHKAIWCQKIQSTQTLKPPFHKNSSFARPRPGAWTETPFREIICLIFIGCFTQVSLELPRREGRCSQCWNYVSLAMKHLASITRGFFFFLLKSVLFLLCGTAWVHLANFIIRKNESRRPNRVPNITQNH